MPHTVGGPLPVAARQGRERQRYTADGARCVAGCIPVRHGPDPGDPVSVSVCMITSRSGRGYVFPKGGWEVDESVEVAAARETVEEAGVRGELELPGLGTFAFRSGKAERQGAAAQKGRCEATVFAMAVSEELAEWPESRQRQRVWCTVADAYRRARYDWMRDALRAWVERKGWADAVELVDPEAEAEAEAGAGAGAGCGAAASPSTASASPAPDTPIVVQS